MFKFESFITPLLMGYIDKYVKLKPEDFQLSLWGGDIFLNKLDLRVDIIEQALKLPVVITSGFVHELRIHVPWTRLYSEPVVITINTIECILKVNRNLDVTEISSQEPIGGGESEKPEELSYGEEENLPPGYLQSLATKILHNINVVVNNMIIKFVEDDIVLSLNVKSAECYSVDAAWNRAFKELTAADLSLGKVVDIQDLTLCLDTCNANGRIDTYQDPVLYRCSLTCRLLMLYESIQSKFPFRTLVNVLNEQLDISLTDTQLPVFCQLVNLFITMYYESSECIDNRKIQIQNEAGKKEIVLDDIPQSSDWSSWMWSHVSNIAYAGDVESSMVDERYKSSEPSFFIFGLYLKKISVNLKECKSVKQLFKKSSNRTSFVRYAVCNIMQTTVEAKISSSGFVNVEFGISEFQVCGINADTVEPVIFASVVDDEKADDLGYMSGSLFDGGASSLDYLLDIKGFLAAHDETYAMQRFGFFWMNYVFIPKEQNCPESETRETESLAVNEEISLKLIFGACKICLCEELFETTKHVLNCLSQFTYKPYQPQPSGERPLRAQPSDAEVSVLESEIPMFTYSVVVIRLCLCLHPLSGRVNRKGLKALQFFQTENPVLVMDVDRIVCEIKTPIFGQYMSEVSSMLYKVSEKLLDNCQWKLSLGIYQIQVQLHRQEGLSSRGQCVILSPCDAIIRVNFLLFPKFWKNVLQPHSQYVIDINSISVNFSKSQLLILLNILLSWSSILEPLYSSQVSVDIRALLSDLEVSGGEQQTKPPCMRLSLGGFLVEAMWTEAIVALKTSLSTCELCIVRNKAGTDFFIPVVSAPVNLSESPFDANIEENISLESQPLRFVDMTVQLPRDIRTIQAPAAVYFHMSGVMCHTDSALLEWMLYRPKYSPVVDSEHIPSTSEVFVNVDSALASATIPESTRLSGLADISPYEGSMNKIRASDSVISTHSSKQEPLAHTSSSKSGDDLSVLEQYLLDFYPYIKIAEVNVSFEGCAVYMVSGRTSLWDSETRMSLREMYRTHSLADTVVVTLPSVAVHSGRRQSAAQHSIPIRSLEQALAKEKFPWQLSFSKATIFTVHNSTRLQNLMLPTSVCGTLTVNSKYDYSSSSNESRLNWCLHADVGDLSFSLSRDQLCLISVIAGDVFSAVSSLYEDISNILPQQMSGTETGDDLRRGHGSNTRASGSCKDREQYDLSSDTSLKHSRDAFHERVIMDESRSSITFWLQLTLPKVAMEFSAGNTELSGDTKVCLVFEDSMISMDSSEFQSTVKLSIGSVDVACHSANRAQHQTIDLINTLISSSDIAARNTHILLPSSLASSYDTSTADTSFLKGVRAPSSFLGIVFTQTDASKLQKVNQSGSDACLGAERDSDQPQSSKYVRRVEIDCQPVDVMYCDEALTTIIALFSFPLSSSSSFPAPLNVKTPQPSSPQLESLVSLASFPQVSLNSSGFRIFYVCNKEIAAGGSEYSKSSTFILEVCSCSLSPHVNNPLPRRSLLYEEAVSDRMSSIDNLESSGCDDQQYQIRLAGVSLSTGNWEDLMIKKTSNCASVEPLPQNPALEWNSLQSRARERDRVNLTPVIMYCDFDVTAALPMLYKDEFTYRLLSGYSFEFNASSDINVMLNVDQCKQFISILDKISAGERSRDHNTSSVFLAVEECSVNSAEPAPVCSTSKRADRSYGQSVPVDVLVTAGKVSLMLYSYRNEEQSLTTSSQHLESEETKGKETVRKNVIPCVSIRMYQPHVVVKQESHVDMIKLSFYDCLIEGAENESVRRTDLCPVPHQADYSIRWLETKPGRINPKTGLRPNLFTLLININHSDMEKCFIEVDLERPVVYRCSAQQFLLLSAFISDISVSRTNVKPKELTAATESTSIDSLMPRVRNINLSTSQIVVAYSVEDKHKQTLTVLQLSMESLKLSSVLKVCDIDILKELVGSVSFKGVALKTIIDGAARRIIHPSTFIFTARMIFTPHSGSKNFPKLSVGIACSGIQVHIYNEMIQRFLELSGSKNNEELTGRSELSRRNVSWYEGFICNDSLQVVQYSDDLKSEFFTYSTGISEYGKINVGDIQFWTDENNSCATMTWRYAEFRIVRRLVTLPVPFETISRPNTDQSSSRLTSRRLPCVLQSSPLGEEFIDCVKFWVSETECSEIELPVATDSCVQPACSDIWRVKLLFSEMEDCDVDYPVISPHVLATSVTVDSVYCPRYIAPVELLCKVDCVRVKVFCDSAADLADKSEPGTSYTVLSSLPCHEATILTLTDTCISINSSLYQCAQLNARMGMSVSCDVLDYRNLALLPLIESSQFESRLHVRLSKQEHRISVESEFGKIIVKLGESSLWTLNCLTEIYCGGLEGLSEHRVIVSHYIIYNDTVHTLYVGQEGTDELITVESRQARQYFWPSIQRAQVLRVHIYDGEQRLSTFANINKLGVCALSMLANGDKAGKSMPLILTMNRMGHIQKKVTISGQLSVLNLLNETIEISGAGLLSGASCIIHSKMRSPSCIQRHSDLQCTLRVRSADRNLPWSQDINVSTSEFNKLLRLATNSQNKLHVWCRAIECTIRTIQNIKQYMIVFSPVFVTKSLLSSPVLVNIYSEASKMHSQLKVEGRGNSTQLELLDGGDSAHQLTLQLTADLPVSSPAVSLSPDTIKQVGIKSIKDQCASTLSKRLLEQSQGAQWPFNSLHKDEHVISSGPDGAMMMDDVVVRVDVDPNSIISTRALSSCSQSSNINLNVNLRQLWPDLNTVCIDVVPNWLLINEISFDVIIATSDGLKLRVPACQQVAHDVLSDVITVGVVLGTELHKSAWISISDEDNTLRFLPKYENVLYKEGNLSVNIPVVHGGFVVQICCLSIHSTVTEQMRVITLRESFNVFNSSALDIDIVSVCVLQESSLSKVYVPDNIDPSVAAVASKNNGELQSLLLWNLLTATPVSVNSCAKLNCVQYVMMRLRDSCGSSDQLVSNPPSSSHGSRWSHPVKLKHSQSGKKLSASVPIDSGKNSVAYSLIVQSDSSMYYLSVAEDDHPEVLLHNNCSEPLYFGEASTESSSEHSTAVVEQLGVVSNLPRVEATGYCCYNLPSSVDTFPRISESPDIKKLRLAAVRDKVDVDWSRTIDLQSDASMFITIPNCYDMKVSIKKHGFTIHVYIDPISRAEVSAKEIRGRIASNTTTEKQAKGNEPKYMQKVITYNKEVIEHPIESHISIVLLCKLARCSLMDEAIHQSSHLTDLLAVTVDKLCLSLYPTIQTARSASMHDVLHHSFLLSCLDMQIDNQEFGVGNYDFPVVLMRQSDSLESAVLLEAGELSLQEQVSIIHSNGLMRVSGELISGAKVSASLRTLHVMIRPVKLQVEDTFVYKIITSLGNLVHSPAVTRSQVVSRTIPARLKVLLPGLTSPFRIEHLCIDSVHALVSFRATLKVFVSTTDTPLTLRQFEKRRVYTTIPQLVKALTVHYVSGIAVRAGIVLGSLEILGNPTGFIRLLGDGVSDMIFLPYYGFTGGPSAFLTGVAQGMASVTRHVYQGTLLSLNNFATSVSRNAEKFSLDSDHIRRNELLRRRRPSGISEGLVNGLTGFGLSLLGAVAGIADQPLQAFTQEYAEESDATTIAHTRGIIGGFGRGLVGAVMKPIGGTAELVSQTSLGLLTRVDVQQVASQRFPSYNKTTSELPYGSAKYAEKFRDMLNKDMTILHCIVCKSASSHMPTHCALVLTPDYLLVVNCEDDQLVLTLPLPEFKCRQSEPSTIEITPYCAQSEQSIELQRARVAEFLETVDCMHNSDINAKWTHREVHEHPSTPDRVHEHSSMSGRVHEHPSTPDRVHEHSSMSGRAHEHPSTPNRVHEHSSLSGRVHEYPSTPGRVLQYPSSGRVHEHPSMSGRVHEHPSTPGQMPEHPSAGRVLKHPSTSGRVPEHKLSSSQVHEHLSASSHPETLSYRFTTSNRYDTELCVMLFQAARDVYMNQGFTV